MTLLSLSSFISLVNDHLCQDVEGELNQRVQKHTPFALLGQSLRVLETSSLLSTAVFHY